MNPERVKMTLIALRGPDESLAEVSNTVRQAAVDLIQDLFDEGKAFQAKSQRDQDIAKNALERENGWRARLGAVQEYVSAQAEDEGLWFEAQTAAEAYLQQELRKLHAVIEDTKSEERAQVVPQSEDVLWWEDITSGVFQSLHAELSGERVRVRAIDRVLELDDAQSASLRSILDHIRQRISEQKL